MVQQTADSKFSEYTLANPETGFPKKTALRDLQNENRKMVTESDGSSPLKNNGPVVEAIKVSGVKRPQQTPASNNGHLVYVRRKTESEHKSSTCNKTNDQPRKLEHDEKNHEQSPIKDSTICVQEDVPEPKVSSEGALNSGKSNISAPLLDSNPLELSVAHLEERYFRLQSFLKALDQSSQDDYRKILHSLSSVDLSRIAVELEKRSIQLSLEEAREVQRAKLVDVLDKFPRNIGQ